MNLEAVIVNYATPSLTRRAVWSLLSLYPELSIVVVDNGSPDDSAARLGEEFSHRSKVRIHRNASNIHHGPAMDAVLRETQHRWVLLFDSDCIAYRGGFLQDMLDAADAHDGYMVGQLCIVDSSGFNSEERNGHRYIHPKCALVASERYVTLPPFEKHGAPCLSNAVAAVKAGLNLVDFPVDDYVFHAGRGTVARHGYGLGLQSRVVRRLHVLRKLFG